MVSLKDLRIYLNYCPQITTTGVKSFIRQTSKPNNSLKKLTLGFKKSLNGEKSIRGLKTILKEIKRSLKGLEQLCFSFTLKNQEKGFTAFISHLNGNLSRLKQLTLGIAHGPVTDNRVIKLGNQITQNLIHLKELKLVFPKSDELSNEGVITLVEFITERLPQLEKPSLTFASLNLLTSQALGTIGAHISNNLKQLTYLDLDNRGCSNLTDKGLDTLTEELVKIKSNLQTLIICVYRCVKITDEAVKRNKMLLVGIPRLLLIY